MHKEVHIDYNYTKDDDIVDLSGYSIITITRLKSIRTRQDQM